MYVHIIELEIYLFANICGKIEFTIFKTTHIVQHVTPIIVMQIFNLDYISNYIIIVINGINH